MKHCPACNKTYTDDQNFCAIDGSALLLKPSQPDQQASSVPSSPNYTAPQPVQIIQMTAPKSKTGLYVVIGLLLALTMIFGSYFYLRHADAKEQRAQAKQEQQDQAAYEKDYAQRVDIAQLDANLVKIALDNAASGSSASYRDCAQGKLDLYQQRYNVWVGEPIFCTSLMRLHTKATKINVLVAFLSHVNNIE